VSIFIGAKWTNEPSKFNIKFDKITLKAAIKYLLENSYFKLGDSIFRQIIGIPMGSDPAPFFANLFLYFYENKWMLDLKKKDILLARKLSNIFRFIDDLNAINDNMVFQRSYKDIYPVEMVLGRENKDDFSASFLDLDIKIINNKFQVGLFDKRDAFPFTIVRMPHKSSNVPSTMFYSSFGAELLRIARASNNQIQFTNSIKPLVNRMLKQGAYLDKLSNVTKKFYNRHFEEFTNLVHNFDVRVSLLL